MKRKSLATLLSGFLTVCLTGVGFASWLITGGDTESTQGNIVAESVSDKRCTVSELKVSYPEEFDTINFGPNTKSTSGWLRTDEATENLTATITFKVAHTDYLAENGISITVEDINGLYDAAVTATYVGALPTIGNGITLTTGTTDEEKTTTYSAEIKFSWGEKFGKNNPYTFYSSKTNISDEEIDAAIEDLTELYKLNGESFKVTVATTSK